MSNVIKEQAKRLKLSYISNHIDQHIEDSERENDNFETFLTTLFEYEIALRHENSVTKRIKQASL